MIRENGVLFIESTDVHVSRMLGPTSYWVPKKVGSRDGEAFAAIMDRVLSELIPCNVNKFPMKGAKYAVRPRVVEEHVEARCVDGAGAPDVGE